MKSLVRKFLQRLFYKISVWLFPELAILKNPDLNFGPLISQAENCKFANNVKLYQPYHINHCEIERYTYISQNSFISQATIGAFCSIGPNFFCGWGIHPVSSLSTHPMFYSTKKQNGISLSEADKIEERQKITIGNDVFIGANVTVLDGITIGDGAIIGAGAVVSKDIPPYAIAVGCPIKVIKYRHSPEVISNLLQIKWWNWDISKLSEVEKHFEKVETFVKNNPGTIIRN
jgi:virginiamycin A acetyltransferase